jgi:hypothetical protein
VSYDHAFDSAFDDVMAKISAENKAIGSDRAVTVAVLGSFTFDDTSPVSAAEMRRQLIGTYVAQRRFNQDKNADSIRMKIAVANEGSHQRQWREAVDQLVGLKDDDAPLVAVTGLGVSVNQTRDAAKVLSAAQIPMVGTITTADELTSIDGYFRVSPPNREYVASLRSYVDEVGKVKDLKSAVLAADETPAKDDLFTSNLAADLKDEFAKEIAGRSERTFFGSANPGGGTPKAFNRLATVFCTTKAKVLLYAGRSNDLGALLSALMNTCSGQPVTVMTGGSDDLAQFSGLATDLKAAHITLVYASGTDPSGWLAGQKDVPKGFPGFLKAYRAEGFGEGDLSDGGAMSAHDSVSTVATAIEVVFEQPKQPVTGVNVRREMENLNGPDLVRGATGNFSFAPRGPKTGDPIDKPVPVITIPGTGNRTSLYVTSR